MDANAATVGGLELETRGSKKSFRICTPEEAAAEKLDHHTGESRVNESRDPNDKSLDELHPVQTYSDENDFRGSTSYFGIPRVKTGDGDKEDDDNNDVAIEGASFQSADGCDSPSFRRKRAKSYVELQQEDIQANDEVTDRAKMRKLAESLFELWDISRSEVVTLDEMVDCGTEEDFATALMRALAQYSGDSSSFRLEHLSKCLVTLKIGTLSEKVALFAKFIDRSGNDEVDFAEAGYYLKIAPTEICKKLGFVTESGDSRSLTYTDILALFENSDRGDEAITIFCEHILKVLSSKSQAQHRVRRQMSLSGLHAFGSMTMFGTAGSGGDRAADGVWACSVQHPWHRLQAQLHKIPKATFFLTVLVLLQIALWLTNFFYYYNRGMPPAFCCAKGFGLNLRVMTVLLFASMARTTMGFVSNLKFLKWLVPMGINIQIHSFIGFSLVLHAFGHMIGHIAFHEEHVEDGFKHAFEQKSLVRGAAWTDHGRGDGITGYILLIILLVMAGTALLRSRSSEFFRYFSLSHYLYNAWLVFLFLHVPHLWKWFLITGAVMLLERGYDYLQQTTHATLLTSRPCSNGVTFLSVPRHGDPTFAGSYYRIKVPAISAVEWHPFSLAGSVSSHHLTFFIASVGDWTRELHRLVSDPHLRATTSVQVQGPFLAPAHIAVKDPTATTLLVASGIGITPFFSVMATKVTEEQNYESDRAVFEALFNESLHDYREVVPGPQAYGGLPVGFNVIRNARTRFAFQPPSTKQPFAAGAASGVDEDIESGRAAAEVEPESGHSAAESKADKPSPASKAVSQKQQQGSGGSSSKPKSALKPSQQGKQQVQNVLKRTVKYEEVLEEVKVLRVVWAIREASELMFYLDYVFELVRMQEAMHQPAVQVDVYLTGLGKGTTDLRDMMSQTLFLLTVAKRTSHFMKIHFGRPDLEKIVKQSVKPDQVFYCGGQVMKDMLTDICTQEDVNVPFHPEDFDAGATWINGFVRTVTAPVRWLQLSGKGVGSGAGAAGAGTRSRGTSSGGAENKSK